MDYRDQAPQGLSAPSPVELGVHVQTEDVVVTTVTALLPLVAMATRQQLALYQRADQLHPTGRDVLPPPRGWDGAHEHLGRENTHTTKLGLFTFD